MSFQQCSAKCVVRHSHEKMCEFRSLQCVFVTCNEKIPFRNLLDHLWSVHKLLQFPDNQHSSKFSLEPNSFSKNYAARPFLLVFNDRQFILEICRKHDTGLWHFWVYLVGSPWDANFFEFEFKLLHKKGKEELSYRGPVVSIDIPFNDVFRGCHSLVVTDNALKRFCDQDSMSVSYKIELRVCTNVDLNDFFQSFPRDDGDATDNFGVRPTANAVSSNGHFDHGGSTGSHRASPVAAQLQQLTFANAPKAGPGVQNRYGKMIYPDSHKLFVGNLFDECKDLLIETFSPFGAIADVLFFKNPPPVKKSPIYAFVIFHDEKSVGLALKNKPLCLPNGQSLIVLSKVDSRPGEIRK